MERTTFIIINFCALIVMALVLLVVWKNGLLKKKTKQGFYAALVVELIELAAYDGELYCALLPVRTVWRTLFSAIGYTLRPLLLLILLYMIADHLMKKRTKRFLNGLLIVNTLLAFSAFFTNVAYTYSENNHFSRGPIGMVFYVVALICLGFVLYYALQDLRENNAEITMTIAGVAIIVIGMLLEWMSDIGGSSKPAFAFATIFMYLHFQVTEENAYAEKLKRKMRTDPLTGVLNRQAYMDDMKALSL